jgi:hypothetical protein
MPAIAFAISSRPTLTSPVTWFSKTESSVCSSTIAPTSCAPQAAL